MLGQAYCFAIFYFFHTVYAKITRNLLHISNNLLGFEGFRCPWTHVVLPFPNPILYNIAPIFRTGRRLWCSPKFKKTSRVSVVDWWADISVIDVWRLNVDNRWRLDSLPPRRNKKQCLILDLSRTLDDVRPIADFSVAPTDSRRIDIRLERRLSEIHDTSIIELSPNWVLAIILGSRATAIHSSYLVKLHSPDLLHGILTNCS